jgi:LAS superfamily LD-carboxypeptidase LdcB
VKTYERETGIYVYRLEDIWDRVTQERIMTLHPSIRQNAISFIIAAQEQGLYIRVTDAYRSIEEQDRLYNQSRYGSTEPWATDARGGSSFHNYGLAIDVVEMRDGVPYWGFDTYRVAQIAITYGFEWPLPNRDPGHLQITFGYHAWQLLEKVQSSILADGYIVFD